MGDHLTNGLHDIHVLQLPLHGQLCKLDKRQKRKPRVGHSFFFAHSFDFIQDGHLSQTVLKLYGLKKVHNTVNSEFRAVVPVLRYQTSHNPYLHNMATSVHKE